MANNIPDPYAVLGVGRDATPSEIKQAYRALAKINHPDRVPASDKEAATAKMKEINEANSILGDADERRKYDRENPAKATKNPNTNMGSQLNTTPRPSAPPSSAPSGPAPSGPVPSGPAPSGPAPSGPAPSSPAPSAPPVADDSIPNNAPPKARVKSGSASSPSPSSSAPENEGAKPAPKKDDKAVKYGADSDPYGFNEWAQVGKNVSKKTWGEIGADKAWNAATGKVANFVQDVKNNMSDAAHFASTYARNGSGKPNPDPGGAAPENSGPASPETPGAEASENSGPTSPEAAGATASGNSEPTSSAPTPEPSPEGNSKEDKDSNLNKAFDQTPQRAGNEDFATSMEEAHAAAGLSLEPAPDTKTTQPKQIMNGADTAPLDQGKQSSPENIPAAPAPTAPSMGAL